MSFIKPQNSPSASSCAAPENSLQKPPSPLPLWGAIVVLCAAVAGLTGSFKTPSRAESTLRSTLTERTLTESTPSADQGAGETSENQPLLAANPALPQPVAATVQEKIRWVRVGLSTQGGAIVMLSPNAMTITDATQPGRRLAVKAGEQVSFFGGPSTSIDARGARFTGSITVRTDAGDFGAWQTPRVSTSAITRVATNGQSARYARPYRGHFEVAPLTYTFERAKHLGNLRLVNIVPMEEYLKGVVPWEMTPSAPLEALKAQAICARSETLHKIANGRHARDGFEICDYDHCQGYPGTENEKPSTTTAVEQTRGLVIYHNGKIADAVYGTNSGGITAASEDVWRGPPPAYLRSKRDFLSNSNATRVVKNRMTESDWVKYCTQNLDTFAQPNQSEINALAARRARSPRTAALFQSGDLPEFYRWTRVVNPYDLAKAVNSRSKTSMSYISEIRIGERAPSGHIKKLVLVGHAVANNKITSTSSVTLEGDSQIRAMLSGRLGSTTALPSSTFVVLPRLDAQKRLTAFVLKGAGWGHGVGMCQRGAQNRAKAGWNARRIIEFYYDNVQVLPMS